MAKPVTKLEQELERRVGSVSISTDINYRWEHGIDHHPEAEKLAREIAAIDWLYGHDSLGLKFGGDGDNGENLAYLLDILFDLRDAESGSAA